MPNALAGETSPYLRQHADNPVDWQPWSRESLALARAQNKPILLSIGYSACHWCHVMAHESFEDEATAALMNRHFVNIKVDREERPDLDRIYQTAHYLLTQRPGGWPLTMFLAPANQLPFFGGTYFPDEPRHGLISFRQLLERIAEIFAQEPERIEQQAQAVQQAMIDIEIRENQNRQGADLAAIDTFETRLLEAYDAEHGGLGRAPKFPQPAILSQALDSAGRKDRDGPLFRAVCHSLRQIARGGIQDHVGGGFYRYSVDAQWAIPHFEKMLYDNGQLLALFSDAYRLTRDSLFQDAVDGIVGWLQAEMRSGSGAYYAALDADSEGAEGRFYLWTPDEVERIVGAETYPAFAFQYGLDRAPNFEGRWHLHGYHDAREVIDRFGIDTETYRGAHALARERLLAVRNRRVRPGLDDKVLTAWNALVIRGLARAARVFMREDYAALARECLAAIRRECWHDGRLLALGAGAGKRLPAYLDDHAHLLQAVLDCLQLDWREADFDFAGVLARQLSERFEDRTYGGFYFTADDHEQLIQRPKSWADEAMPSGNAAAALALHRLGLLRGDPALTASAERALQSVADNVNQNPLHAAGFVGLLAQSSSPPMQIVARGDRATLSGWRQRLLPLLGPGQCAFFIPQDAQGLPPALADKTASRPAVWICEGFACRAPIFDIGEVAALLDEQDQAPDQRH